MHQRIGIFLLLTVQLIQPIVNDALKGNHVCMENLTYTTYVQKLITVPVSERKYKWCFNIPPRCSYYTTTFRNDYISVPTNRTKLVATCCEGYIEDKEQKICVEECPDCMEGKCLQGECLCNSGFMGIYCNIACSEQFWGPNCVNECLCERGGICDATNGNCICPSGWHGKRCDIQKCDDEKCGSDLVTNSKSTQSTTTLILDTNNTFFEKTTTTAISFTMLETESTEHSKSTVDGSSDLTNNGFSSTLTSLGSSSSTPIYVNNLPIDTDESDYYIQEELDENLFPETSSTPARNQSSENTDIYINKVTISSNVTSSSVNVSDNITSYLLENSESDNINNNNGFGNFPNTNAGDVEPSFADNANSNESLDTRAIYLICVATILTIILGSTMYLTINLYLKRSRKMEIAAVATKNRENSMKTSTSQVDHLNCVNIGKIEFLSDGPILIDMDTKPTQSTSTKDIMCTKGINGNLEPVYSEIATEYSGKNLQFSTFLPHYNAASDRVDINCVSKTYL